MRNDYFLAFKVNLVCRLGTWLIVLGAYFVAFHSLLHLRQEPTRPITFLGLYGVAMLFTGVLMLFSASFGRNTVEFLRRARHQLDRFGRISPSWQRRRMYCARVGIKAAAHEYSRVSTLIRHVRSSILTPILGPIPPVKRTPRHTPRTNRED